MLPAGLEPTTTDPKSVMISISPRELDLIVPVRPEVIETSPVPWQGTVLPLNHGRE